jgi:dATP pyrophosphohydrolase
MTFDRDVIVCHVLWRVGGRWHVLQLLRSPGRYMAGTWQFVSGGVEPNEATWAAAVREVREETALVPSALFNVCVGFFYVPEVDQTWRAFHFAAEVPEDAAVRLNDEHDEFRWVPLDEVDPRVTWPTDHAALAIIRRDVLPDGLPRRHLRITTTATA